MSSDNIVHENAPYDADDKKITHHIVDHKQIEQSFSRSVLCNISYNCTL